MEIVNIKGIQLSDGTIIDASGLVYIHTSEKGNLEISSPEGAKINIEPADNLALKPGGKVQLDTSHRPIDELPEDAPIGTPDGQDEFKVSVIKDNKEKVEGLSMDVAGLKFFNEFADGTEGWDSDKIPVHFKTTKNKWTKLNIHASSIDLRARAQVKNGIPQAGTGGGIAVQIANTDKEGHENKFKIETDRITDVENTPTYNGVGGTGIEIVTINSQFLSAYNRTYRFKKNAPIYPVTRGSLQLFETGKTDYPTQEDDSKDIISTFDYAYPVTWADIIEAVQFFKYGPGKENGPWGSNYTDWKEEAITPTEETHSDE